MFTNTLFDQINATLTTLNGVAIDDHVDSASPLFDRLTLIKEIGILGIHVVAFDSSSDSTYSFNSLYMGSDGMVHISRSQVGITTSGDFSSIDNQTVISVA